MRSKHDPVCEEIEILDANPRSSLVHFPDGRETTVSTSDLAPAGDPTPQPESDTVVDTKESDHEAVGDSYNESSSSKEGTAEANKSCSDVGPPSENLETTCETFIANTSSP